MSSWRKELNLEKDKLRDKELKSTGSYGDKELKSTWSYAKINCHDHSRGFLLFVPTFPLHREEGYFFSSNPSIEKNKWKEI